MPIFGAAMMDTDRIIPQNGSSPGSQSQSLQQQIGPSSSVTTASGGPGGTSGASGVPRPFKAGSVARKKKTERAAPPALSHADLMDSSYLNGHSYANTPISLQNGNHYGLTNHGYAQEQSILSPSMSDASRLNMTRDTNMSMQDDSDEMQEVIEVQILPQDENWGEVGTTVTAATTEFDYGNIDTMDKWRLLETDRGMGFRCRRHFGSMLAGLLAMLAFASPIVMVALPSVGGVLSLRDHQLVCGVECDGMLVSLSFKLFILGVGTWAVFIRRARATLPRIHVYRAVVCVLVLIFLVSYWLFYASHIVQERDLVRYKGLVGFALNLVDSLLFVHYLAVLLMELRSRQAQYYVKVVRSPDGESKGFPIGQMSVQGAASWVLDRYYTEFPIYNPYLDRLTNPGARHRKGVKVYDVDGHGANINDGNSTVVSVASKGRSHNDRFYEEFEHDRKVKKRRARLVTAAEEAFTHIKRMRENQFVNDKSPMESYEAAQAIFPTLSRPLQKYLRATRQQPRHTMESILEHLSTCLSYDMSPRTFLEKYLVTSPVLQNDKEIREVQNWSLVSEKSLYRDIQAGSIFQLRQGDISLLCQIYRLPHFNMMEEIIEAKSNRFVLRLNSETSV